MTDKDLERELTKIEHTLDWVMKHLTLQNEANAALHMNDKIFYSPLTTSVNESLTSARRMLWDLRGGVDS